MDKASKELIYTGATAGYFASGEKTEVKTGKAEKYLPYALTAISVLTHTHPVWYEIQIVTPLKTNSDKYSSAPEGNQFSEAFSQLYIFSSQQKTNSVA